MHKRHHTFRNIILIILTVIILLIVWGFFSSYHILSVTKYVVCSDKVAGDVNVILISDLHNHSFGQSSFTLVKRIRNLQPDLILMAGDFLNASSLDDHVPLELISQLVEIAPVYYSLGNQEKGFMDREWENDTLILDLESAGAIVLDEQFVCMEVNGTDLVIGGMYEYAFGQDGYGDMDKSKIPEERLAFLESFQSEQAFKIMMAHRPECFLVSGAKDTWNIDLVVSGHLHGGHVIIPFVGGLYGGDFGWFPKYAYGEFHFSAVKNMIITRGLGSGHQKIPRFNNMPEIVMIRLKENNE